MQNTTGTLNDLFSIIRRIAKTKTKKKKKTEIANLNFWQADKVITALFFVPGVAAAQALTTLNKLGCWLAKQTNATSAALSALLTNTDSVRHATLQNRTAIDFLLLGQGHWCDEFEGMCCMNLSDHSQSTHQQLSKLKELTDKLTSSTWGWNHGCKAWE